MLFDKEIRLEAENKRLRAELEAAKKDAERYRWLRDVAWNDGQMALLEIRYGPEDWNDYIDAAIAANQPTDTKCGAQCKCGCTK